MLYMDVCQICELIFVDFWIFKGDVEQYDDIMLIIVKVCVDVVLDEELLVE